MVFFLRSGRSMIALNYVTTTHVGTISKSLNEKSNELVKYRWEMIRNSEAAATLSDEKVLKKYLEINQEVYQLSIALSKKKLFSSLTKTLWISHSPRIRFHIRRHIISESCLYVSGTFRNHRFIAGTYRLPFRRAKDTDRLQR